MVLDKGGATMAKNSRHSLISASSQRNTLDEFVAKMQSTAEVELVSKFGPPADFSFRDIQKMSDLCKSEPRTGPHSYLKIAVELKDPELSEKFKQTKKDNKNEEEIIYYKYCSNAIRLSNNSLRTLEGFAIGLKSVLNDPTTLEWIDLSFNDLVKIDEALLEYVNVKVLYLHANYIEDVRQVNKLAALPKLKTLTLHGNMIEGKKGYRQYVITTLPQVQYFDFSRITKADREKANVWRKLKLVDTGAIRKKKPETTA